MAKTGQWRIQGGGGGGGGHRGHLPPPPPPPPFVRLIIVAQYSILNCNLKVQQKKKSVRASRGSSDGYMGGRGRGDVQMLQQQESELSFNKAALESIADCLVYCGKQGIALRGHRDDSTDNESANKLKEISKHCFFFLRNQ